MDELIEGQFRVVEPAFNALPDGQLSEAVVLPEHKMQLGLLHVDGAGVRIAIWDGQLIRHMAHMKARRWAGELEVGPFGAAFKPVIEALRSLSERVEQIEALVAARRAVIEDGVDAVLATDNLDDAGTAARAAIERLAAMDVEGNA